MRCKITKLLMLTAIMAVGLCLWGCESRPRQEIYTGTPAGPATGTNPETPGSDSDFNGTAPGGNNTADNADNSGNANNGSSETTQADPAGNTPGTDNGATQPDGTTSEDSEPEQTDNPASTENPPANDNVGTENHADASAPGNENNSTGAGAHDNGNGSGNSGNNGNTENSTDAGNSGNNTETADAGNFTENPADAGNTEDIGTTADAGDLPTPPDPPSAPPVLETPTDGVLVTARENSGGSALQRTPETHADAPAEVVANPEGLATYTSADGNIYNVRAFPKNENETLAEWNIRSYYGDSSAPLETTLTANNYPVAMYATDDEGIIPVIHALIATGRFAYRIDWRDPVIPDDAASAVEFIRNNRERYFAIPEHFKVFVRGIAVR